MWIVAIIVGLVSGKVYFKEDFGSAKWDSKWSVSNKWKSEGELGRWDWTAGEWYGNANDKGIKTSENHRFYGLSSKLDEPFTNANKDLVIQFSVKWEQDLDCGGAYIKLLGDMDQSSFGGDTPYQVMFGPDQCGSSNRKTHVIFNYPQKNENLEIKDKVKMESDKLTHLYTLIVRPNNSFEVLIDNKSVREGNLEDSFDFLLPKEIKDPSQSKPMDWVDAKKIPDPSDVKPEGYDDVPAEVPDPEATKPDDWDEEEDGSWEPPKIENPEYKGAWKPKMIANPEYKGDWKHPMIPNPDYVADDKLYIRCNKCTHIGFELWQVTAGTVFDDIIVTDSLQEAKDFAASTFDKKRDAEKEMYDNIEAKKREERATAEKDSAASGPDYEDEEHDEL